jgi:hypothetical protein
MQIQITSSRKSWKRKKERNYGKLDRKAINFPCGQAKHMTLDS